MVLKVSGPRWGEQMRAVRHHGVRHSRPHVLRAGFTLIDVLVSIAVIGVLIGLLVPLMGPVHEAARRVVCQSNVRQVGIGLISYANDWGGNLPPSVYLSAGPGRAMGEPQNMDCLRLVDGMWDGLGFLYIGRYTEASKVFYCPSHRGEKPYSRFAPLFNEVASEILCNYHFRGEGPIGYGPTASRTRNLDKIDPAASSLIADGLQLQSDYSHRTGVNFFRADLSVHWYSDPSSSLTALMPVTKADANRNRGYVPDLWNKFDAFANTEGR